MYDLFAHCNLISQYLASYPLQMRIKKLREGKVCDQVHVDREIGGWRTQPFCSVLAMRSLGAGHFLAAANGFSHHQPHLCETGQLAMVCPNASGLAQAHCRASLDSL